MCYIHNTYYSLTAKQNKSSQLTTAISVEYLAQSSLNFLEQTVKKSFTSRRGHDFFFFPPRHTHQYGELCFSNMISNSSELYSTDRVIYESILKKKIKKNQDSLSLLLIKADLLSDSWQSLQTLCAPVYLPINWILIVLFYCTQ